MKTDLNDTFKSRYVQELSIVDHCREVVLIDSRQKTEEAEHKIVAPFDSARLTAIHNVKDSLKESKEDQLMDLMLLLMVHFEIDPWDVYPLTHKEGNRMNARLMKFRQMEQAEK